MHRSVISLAAMLAIAIGAGAAAAQETSSATASDASAIRGARLAQTAAMTAGNVDRAARWWTEDVTIRRGLGAPVTGIAAYKAILDRAPVSDTALLYDRKTTRIAVSDHWPLAFETGTWTARRGGKGEPLITGQYSAQWVKRDGKWFIRAEVFVALKCAGVGCDAQAVR